MEIKYSKHFLNKLEDLFSESDYVLRYERGDFKSGYCILQDNKVAVINKFYSLDGKINCLIDIIREVELSQDKMSEKNLKLLSQITQIEIN